MLAQPCVNSPKNGTVAQLAPSNHPVGYYAKYSKALTFTVLLGALVATAVFPLIKRKLVSRVKDSLSEPMVTVEKLKKKMQIPQEYDFSGYVFQSFFELSVGSC